MNEKRETRNEKRVLKLWIDGASQGNPGPAAIGVVVRDEDGQTLAEIGEPVGVQTSNVAEYLAVLRGLRECLDLGADSLRVFSDSQLLVRQLNRQYKVKSANLKPLHEEALSLFRRFRHATVEHVSREQNRQADRLAAQALSPPEADRGGSPLLPLGEKTPPDGEGPVDLGYEG